uniref:Uncharacterized protein n=1 Tax=Oryza punctata TaxID=4537 RepID=A0A0E0L980_ORYPU
MAVFGSAASQLEPLLCKSDSRFKSSTAPRLHLIIRDMLVLGAAEVEGEVVVGRGMVLGGDLALARGMAKQVDLEENMLVGVVGVGVEVVEADKMVVLDMVLDPVLGMAKQGDMDLMVVEHMLKEEVVVAVAAVDKTVGLGMVLVPVLAMVKPVDMVLMVVTHMLKEVVKVEAVAVDKMVVPDLVLVPVLAMVKLGDMVLTMVLMVVVVHMLKVEAKVEVVAVDKMVDLGRARGSIGGEASAAGGIGRGWRRGSAAADGRDCVFGRVGSEQENRREIREMR